MIKDIFEALGNKIWYILATIFLTLVLICNVIVFYPITISTSMCVQKEDSVILHKTTYRIKTVLKQEGANVKLCVTEIEKRIRTNLVEK